MCMYTYIYTLIVRKASWKILICKAEWSESHSVVSDSLWPHRSYSLWNSLNLNTGGVTFPFSRRSTKPRDWTQVSHIAGGFFLPAEPQGKPFYISWSRPKRMSRLYLGQEDKRQCWNINIGWQKYSINIWSWGKNWGTILGTRLLVGDRTMINSFPTCWIKAMVRNQRVYAHSNWNYMIGAQMGGLSKMDKSAKNICLQKLVVNAVELHW